MRFVIVLSVTLLFSVPAAAFDWGLFVRESLVATDIWQTREVYQYTASSPRCVQVSKHEERCFYEGNALIAGREWEQVQNHIRLTPVALNVLPDSDLKMTLETIQLIRQIYAVFNNNRLLSEIGMAPRYMLAYRWTW